MNDRSTLSPAAEVGGHVGPLRVGSTYSPDEEAAVQGKQSLKGSLPSRCCPTPGDRRTTAKAEQLPDAALLRIYQRKPILTAVMIRWNV